MILALFAAASVASAPTEMAQSALQPWASFVGHCFSGPAPGKGVDTHCFEALYGGQHVRDRHEVKVDGKTVYAGETLYSVEGPNVTFVYWNSLGGVGRGAASVAGDQMSFAGDMRASPTGASQHFDATWRKVDGGYEVSDEGRKGSLFRRVD
jgi:hypothetical protein